MIFKVRSLLEASDVASVLGVAIKAIPPRMRPSAFAVVADLLFADGSLDTPERRFLRRLGTQMGIGGNAQRRIENVILLKNQL